MGLKLDIDTEELNKVVQKMGGVSLRAKDIRTASEGIRLLLQEDVDLRFQNAPSTNTGGEAYGGVEWRELSESYLARRPERANGQLLRDTGELLQSMTVEGHPYKVFSSTESETVFGTALIKARTLQRDRPFLFWHPILIEKVATYLANHLEQ